MTGSKEQGAFDDRTMVLPRDWIAGARRAAEAAVRELTDPDQAQRIAEQAAGDALGKAALALIATIAELLAEDVARARVDT